MRWNSLITLSALLGILLWQATGLTGCSSDPPRYPESHDRFERIVQAVKTLQQAYIAHDIQTTNDLLLPLDTLRLWEKEVERDFQTYSDIALDLDIDRISIDGDHISVQISWQGQWKPDEHSNAIKARGHGTLLWSGTHVILLRGVEGDLPFGMAEKQAMS